MQSPVQKKKTAEEMYSYTPWYYYSIYRTTNSIKTSQVVYKSVYACNQNNWPVSSLSVLSLIAITVDR